MSEARSLRLWTVGAAVDTAGDGAILAAIAWFAYQSTGLPGAVIIALVSIPRAIGLLFGGVVADRYGLIRIANYTLVGRIICAAALAFIVSPVFSSVSSLWLAVVGVAFGLLDAFHLPAMSSIVRVLTHDDEAMTGAVARVFSWTLLAEAIGPAAAGVLLAAGGAGPGLASAGLFLLALGCFRLLRQRVPDPPASDETVRQQLREQFSLLRWAGLRVVLGLFFLMNLTTAPVLFVGLAAKAADLDWSPTIFGAVTAAFFAGGVIANRLISRFASKVDGRQLKIAMRLLTVAAVVVVPTMALRNPWLVGACALGLGFMVPASASLLKSATLSRVPERLAGRVGSLATFSVFAGIPLGHLLFGLAASAASLTVAAAIFGGALLVGLIAALIAQGRAEDHASMAQSSSL